MTKNELFDRIVTILHDSFEIEPARITPEARLYDDLDIDSIDAVDLIVQLKPLLGRSLQPDAFKSVRTVQDIVDVLYGVIDTRDRDTPRWARSLPRGRRLRVRSRRHSLAR